MNLAMGNPPFSYYKGTAKSFVTNRIPLFYLRYIYTPDIRSMWGYIVFAFPFIRSFVHTFVHSFVLSCFRHKVKVFALKFIRPHILKTL